MSGAGVHLLAVDDDVVARHRFGPLIALCGEEVDEPGTLVGDDTRYCVSCATEALRAVATCGASAEKPYASPLALLGQVLDG